MEQFSLISGAILYTCCRLCGIFIISEESMQSSEGSQRSKSFSEIWYIILCMYYCDRHLRIYACNA